MKKLYEDGTEEEKQAEAEKTVEHAFVATRKGEKAYYAGWSSYACGGKRMPVVDYSPVEVAMFWQGFQDSAKHSLFAPLSEIKKMEDAA